MGRCNDKRRLTFRDRLDIVVCSLRKPLLTRNFLNRSERIKLFPSAFQVALGDCINSLLVSAFLTDDFLNLRRVEVRPLLKETEGVTRRDSAVLFGISCEDQPTGIVLSNMKKRAHIPHPNLPRLIDDQDRAS